jgi:hypothetical protein
MLYKYHSKRSIQPCGKQEKILGTGGTFTFKDELTDIKDSLSVCSNRPTGSIDLPLGLNEKLDGTNKNPKGGVAEAEYLYAAFGDEEVQFNAFAALQARQIMLIKDYFTTEDTSLAAMRWEQLVQEMPDKAASFLAVTNALSKTTIVIVRVEPDLLADKEGDQPANSPLFTAQPKDEEKQDGSEEENNPSEEDGKETSEAALSGSEERPAELPFSPLQPVPRKRPERSQVTYANALDMVESLLELQSERIKVELNLNLFTAWKLSGGDFFITLPTGEMEKGRVDFDPMNLSGSTQEAYEREKFVARNVSKIVWDFTFGSHSPYVGFDYREPMKFYTLPNRQALKYANSEVLLTFKSYIRRFGDPGFRIGKQKTFSSTRLVLR